MEDFTPSEKLMLYLDGELPQEQEAELFSLLASQADLRTEMRDGLAIRAAIGGDIDAFTPSAEQTGAVFAGLGFTPPFSSTLSTQPKNRQFWVPFLWLLGGLCVGGAATFWFTQSHISQQFAHEKNALERTIERLNKTVSTLSQPVMSSTEIQSPTMEKQAQVKTVVVYRDRIVHMSNQSETVNQDSATENDMSDMSLSSSVAEDISPAKSQEISMNNEQMLQSISPSIAVVESLPTQNTTMQTNLAAALFPRFWSQVRGIGTLSQYPNISASNAVTGLTNVNVAIGYSFSPNVAAGIEIGREPFMLKYTGTVNGRTLRYEQQSSMLLGGLILQGKTNPMENFMGIQPVGTLFLGGSEIGTMGRLSTGVYFPLNANVSFYGGLEYSLMNFTYQSNSFTTQKVGFTYGLQFTF